jgi:hypothetical protein
MISRLLRSVGLRYGQHQGMRVAPLVSRVVPLFKSSVTPSFKFYSQTHGLAKGSSLDVKNSVSIARASYPEFDSLFQHVSRNKLMPELLSKINPDNPKLTQLYQSIKKGDFENKIFHDHQCDIYLLYLIKSQQISLPQGLDVYSYLMALMQFTDKQPLKKDDGDVKVPRKVSVEFLVKDQKISPIGEEYLKDILSRLALMNINIDKDEFRKFILTLSPVDARLTQIETLISPRKNGHLTKRPFVLQNTPGLNNQV